MDETPRARAREHQARRNDAPLEIAKLEDRKLQSRLDEIRLDGNTLTLGGGYGRLGDAFAALEKNKAGRRTQPRR
ncbi:MAG TPA: hypothetical protein VFB20_07060 [Burkholderiales bacterium]|nr:hypothetical protein [Burkholderiales bacterium]